jgi:hypothetical protein
LLLAAVVNSRADRCARVDAAGSRATGAAGAILAASRRIRINPAGPAGIGIGVGLRTERRIHPYRANVLTAIWKTGAASAAPIAAEPVDGLVDDVIAVAELQPVGERQEYRTRDHRIDGTEAGPRAQAGGCSRVIAGYSER